ncbi:MAG TPA: biotin--[acetyl-CoA-carboxylase] ligase [Aquabacterium sp.]|nr:biotin--[acetyl-CoA-carboxylase] ligase [Aquabacterium sp.]HRH29498.1 biotin--[acetyl-CoA-carboxylase] ligase [Aquabacterium sp.]
MSVADEALGLADLNAAAERVWLACQPRWPGLSVEVAAELDSTNTRALQLGREGADAPCVVVAWRQTAGRGRAGRAWQAQPGQTLTMSLALPVALDQVPGGGSALSLAVGLSVAEALTPLLPTSAPSIGLKWPNDLWVNDHKLGGILIEAIQAPGLPAGQRWVVIGIGLNLSHTAPEWQAERTDLSQLGACVSAGQAMDALVPPLLQACTDFERQGFAPQVAAYTARDVLIGRQVQLWRQPAAQAAPGTPDAHGCARGVGPDGALLIQREDGTLAPWHIGEVSVRPRPATC